MRILYLVQRALTTARALDALQVFLDPAGDIVVVAIKDALPGGQVKKEADTLDDVAEQISDLERRAIAAERHRFQESFFERLIAEASGEK